MRRVIVYLLLAFGIAPEAMASCLDDVSSFAEKICGKIQTTGSRTATELNGELRAELSGMVRKLLGNANAGADGKRVTEAYENVLRNDLPKELADVRQCRMKMVEVGRSELCKTAVPPLAAKKYVSEPQDDFPGVVISYPGDWVAKEAGTGSPRILPPLNSPEDRAGLEIQIDIGTVFRAGVEQETGIILPKEEPRYPEKLTDIEHLQYIKRTIHSIQGDRTGFAWKGERAVKIAVYSDIANPPDRRTTEDGWLVDYVEDARHFRELHFFQQTSEYGAPADTFGVVEITCSALEQTFDSVERVCNRIFQGTAFISENYFAD